MNKNLIKFAKKNLQAGAKVLDLGAGDYTDVKELEKFGFKVEGVDLETGVDLEKLYLSKNAPFALVCSNHVLHFLENKKSLIKSAYNNLASKGVFFFQDLEYSDLTTKKYLTKEEMVSLLTSCGFKIENIKKFRFFDDKEGHKHWHNIIEIIAKK